MSSISSATHDSILELVPGYALGALSAPEAQQVAAHLEGCPACRAELEAYRKVVDGLYLAIPQAAPPPALKQKLLRELPHSAEAPQTRRSPQPAAPERKRRFWEGWFAQAPALAWGSLAVVLLLAISNLWLLQRVQQIESANPGQFRVVRLAGTDKAAQATAILVMNQPGDQGTLVVDDLPALDASRQYQLWIIRAGQRASGGVFSVSDEGYGSLVVHADQSLLTADSFGVTIEPAGGSPGPTGDKVLGGKQ